MSRPPKVVALVLNWRQVDATLKVLADLQKCGFATLHVVVIDNGSGDDSVPRLAAAIRGHANSETVILEDNLGYCAGINHGLLRARARGAEYACILNNDVRLPPGFLEPLVEMLDGDRRLAGVGPTIVDPRGRTWCEGGGVGFRPNLVFLHNQGGTPAPTNQGPQDVVFLPGACALYRLDALFEVGDLDEDYFMYWEDVDLAARLRMAGYRLAWLPRVRVVHEASLSSGGGRTPMRKYVMAANSVLYLRRWGRPLDWLALILFDVLLLPLSLLSGTGLRAAWAKARGLVSGMSGRKVTVADVERFSRR